LGKVKGRGAELDAHLSVGITKPRRTPKIPARFRTNVVTEKEDDYFDDEEGMDTARDLLAAVTDNSEDDLYFSGHRLHAEPPAHLRQCDLPGRVFCWNENDTGRLGPGGRVV